jgi:hypothetical protein
MDMFFRSFKSFVNKFLQRELTPKDGISENVITKSESTLEHRFPESLRQLYLTIGNVSELFSIHNKLSSPDQVEIDHDYLIFMDENQNVVSWGFNLEEIENHDPIVWQRNNTENKWYSEELTLIEFLDSMFNWYDQHGIFDEIKG